MRKSSASSAVKLFVIRLYRSGLNKKFFKTQRTQRMQRTAEPNADKIALRNFAKKLCYPLRLNYLLSDFIEVDSNNNLLKRKERKECKEPQSQMQTK